MTGKSSREGNGGKGWVITLPWPTDAHCTVIDLAHSLEPGIPHAPAHPPYAFTLTKLHGDTVLPGGVSAAAEMIAMAGHMGTHVDAPAHISRNGRIHGDLDVTAGQSHVAGLTVGTVEELLPILGAGYLVDATVLRGRDLLPGETVSRATFDEWFETHPLPPTGAIILVRTGWSRYWPDARRFINLPEGVPGVDLDGARWLTEHGVCATGSDTIAYEKTPSAGLEVHVHLLVDHGIPIMEALSLDALAANEIWEFFFVAIPLKIRGGTGSPIRPLAIVSRDPALNA